MSNRANASRYDGSPSVRGGGGGGADLFGFQARRQKDMMALQQAQELERIQAQANADKDVDSSQSKNAGDLYARKVGLDAAKANGLVPHNTSLDDLTKEQQDAINEYGLTHLKLQQKIQDNPDFQDASVKGATALQTKPVVDNNETRARTQALSTTMLPPNTGVRVGAPSGDFANAPENMAGPTQRVTTAGGFMDPVTKQMIGGRPVETYGNPQFPVANLRPKSNTDALQNNVQTKPEAPNVVGGGNSPDLASSFGMQFAPQPPLSQPSLSQPAPLATKPDSNVWDPRAPASSLMEFIKRLSQMQPSGAPSTYTKGLFDLAN